jgi:hypothetical protein
MRPVRNSWNNHVFDIGEDFIERRSQFWRDRVQLRQDCSRLVVRRDPLLTDMLAVIGDPIGEPMKLFAKYCRRNIAEIADVPAQTWLSIFHSGGRDFAANTRRLKSKSKAEMECAEIFVRAGIRIDSIIEANRANR